MGLLAGGNDMELLARTGVGRDINRHRYTPAEIDAALEQPVVAALARLIRFRNAHPAFGGEFSASGSGAEITLSWVAGDERAELAADLTAGAATVTWDDGHRDPERPAERAAPISRRIARVGKVSADVSA